MLVRYKIESEPYLNLILNCNIEIVIYDERKIEISILIICNRDSREQIV